MLGTCHRKKCIWYDYKGNEWKYDLDRVLRQFETESYHDTLDNDLVASRLNELPVSARLILAWASQLGTSFSFELVRRLLGGEFDYEDTVGTNLDSPEPLQTEIREQDVVAGLQAAIQAYVIVDTVDDDRFRFAHDRYIQAAAFLPECTGPKMHFIIARTLLKYYSFDEQYRDAAASHICQSINIVRERVSNRSEFRALLCERAQSATERGARQTAARFYVACLDLLQENPWNDGLPDVCLNETLALHIKTAECYLYLGQYQETQRLTEAILPNVKTPADMAAAWVLQSRIFSQKGEAAAAYRKLRRCLTVLNIKFDDTPTFEKCDKEFRRLTLEIQAFNLEEQFSRTAQCSNQQALGSLMIETISAAIWSNYLFFYETVLIMVNTHIAHGNFPQAGMAYMYLALISTTRFNMPKFSCDLRNIALMLMECWRDPYTMGKGGVANALYVDHFEHTWRDCHSELGGALEYTLQTGDRVSTIMNFAFAAQVKFFASEHLADIESFCAYGCDEIPDWHLDTRGGTMIIAIRQLCRSLQGKTNVDVASDILSDETHDSASYKLWFKESKAFSLMSLMYYESVEICPLFLYDHYHAAVQLGNRCLEDIKQLHSAPHSRFVMLFQGLALAAILLDKLQDPQQLPIETSDQTSKTELNEEIQETIDIIENLKSQIEDWQVVNDVNYLAWSRLLGAKIAELNEDYRAAMVLYEESADHASTHGFIFEEALSTHLLGDFCLRLGSRKLAKSALKESVQLYRRLGAVGVAKHIEDKHTVLLLDIARMISTEEVGIQTDFAEDTSPEDYQGLGRDEDEFQKRKNSAVEVQSGRIDTWKGEYVHIENGDPRIHHLDILDLITILESSQVISSVLDVDQLLKIMCEIILENCRGVATRVAILTEDEGGSGWSIAASGNPDTGTQAHLPGISLNQTRLVAESVILYCIRFREIVFVPNLIYDERFNNTSDALTRNNPGGKSVIAIPICHGPKPLLGVLYLEGEPNAFTSRNLMVLQFLVNQVGISYHNALTLKEVEKVSAFNNSMVEVQKAALAKALEAETNANEAKAEALRSVELAEEAAKAKSIFLANVSHELRTPLNGVIGNSELLMGSKLRPDQVELADSIRISADLLLTVINDILDFSKMEADKMRLSIVAFSADTIVREVVRSASYSSWDKKVKNVEILQDIQLPTFLVLGDSIRLRQVLGNLLSNSLKFTENGSITIGAKTDSETENTVQLTFWVKDTGIGIASAQLDKLFKPFSQADSSTARKYGGSGLGLSICKSIIESMMGGTIRLESEDNKGTTVWFTLTFEKARSTSSPGAYQDEQGEAASMFEPCRSSKDLSSLPREELRVCIAEDNQINQKIAIQFMKKLGIKHVDGYDNGLLAVEALRKMAGEGTPYHIVLMDVQMPVLDGYEATKLLRRDPIDAVRSILVIAMTASAIQGDREKCLASGMNDYLAKPVRLGVLKKKIDQYI